MGKTEKSPPLPAASSGLEGLPWHGHISALTVAPSMRQMGIGAMLSERLEQECNDQKALFMDLFVRKSNHVAINMYRKMGYSTYRVVQDYYSGINDNLESEHALDMRKPLSAGEDGTYTREDGEAYVVQPWDLW